MLYVVGKIVGFFFEWSLCLVGGCLLYSSWEESRSVLDGEWVVVGIGEGVFVVSDG